MDSRIKNCGTCTIGRCESLPSQSTISEWNLGYYSSSLIGGLCSVISHYNDNHKKNTLICVCDRCIMKCWPSTNTSRHHRRQHNCIPRSLFIVNMTPTTGEASSPFNSAHQEYHAAAYMINSALTASVVKCSP
jgi:hypothetical protein